MNDLEQRIQTLEAFMESLRRSSTFPRDVQTAIEERVVGSNGTGTAATTSNGSFPVVVPNVTGTVKLTINGTVYNVLYQ